MELQDRGTNHLNDSWTQHQRGWLWLLCGALMAVRFVGLRIYPQLQIAEGLWTLQAKDAVLFGDAWMNGLRQVYLSPLHFGITWLLFHFLPATLFSVRILSAAFGVLTLGVIWKILRDQDGPEYAWIGVAVIGLSMSMTLINRVALVESGLMLFSALAFYQSTKDGIGRLAGLTVFVAVVLLYKLNGVYLLPALLVPVERRASWGDTGRRLPAVLVGLAVGLIPYGIMYARNKVAFVGAWAFELTKATTSGLHIGRFGIFPRAMLLSIKTIATGVPDLGILSLASLIAFAVLPMGRDRFAWKAGLWLGVGYAWFLLQGHQPLRYFLPLVVPAGILGVHMISRLKPHTSAKKICWSLATIVVLMSLGRLGWGARRAALGNPPSSALQWIESEGQPGSACLATAEIAAATQRKCYAFNRIFHPYPGQAVPTLIHFVQDRHIDYIVFDDWETAPYFLGEPEFTAQLAMFSVVRRGHSWVGIATELHP